MKAKYSIGLFVLSIVIIYLASNYFQGKMYNHAEDSKVKESVTVDGQAVKKNCYYLYERNGYIVIYLNDKKTIYEYTDIKYSDLPELLRMEIRNGKYIRDEKELYGFLENYTS